jgi:hypothetical protein
MTTLVRKTAAAARMLLLCGYASLPLIGSASAQQSSPAPIVMYPTSAQTSSPLWAAPTAGNSATTGRMPLEIPLHALPQGQTVPGGEHASDRAAQTNAAHVLEAQPHAAFAGITQDGLIPPDPNIAVGPNHIVEMVNSEIAIFEKSGNLESGYPKKLSNLWTNLGGACAQSNSGDPVVQYDRLADRWFISQLASLSSPYAECIAVSVTNDPSGSYHLYSYSFGSNLNDYPKFGVWPTASNSAYLGTYNLFANGSTFAGADLCAYDRAAMLAGASAVQICFTRSTSDGGFLPSDLDGAMPPADGEPGYFLAFNANTLNSLTLYKMSLDFGTPANSTLAAASDIGVQSFQPACGGGTCIPQPATNKKLDSLGDRLMYRLAYRNFGSHESMVVNHSVVSGSSVGPRWYLLDATNQGQFAVIQQATYAPDSAYRWMGSIAMDQSGDILLGYSRSSSSSYPSIYAAGRTPNDPSGTLSQEISLLDGGGSQTLYSRWGDYTSMRIDPADDCTFWYVNEYLPQTSFGNWSTYIGAHKFTSCGSGGSGGSADFALAESPSSITLAAGGSNSGSPAQVTVSALNGFAAGVTLSSTCAAPLITCTFGTNPVAGGSGTSSLTVSVASGAASGSTTETITGTGGGLTHSTTFTVTVPAADFAISPATSNLTVRRGATNSETFSLTDVSGTTNSPVSLSVSGLPARVSASFSPNPASSNGGSPTLTIKANRNAPTGTRTVTVTASDGTYSHQASVSLTVQ